MGSPLGAAMGNIFTGSHEEKLSEIYICVCVCVAEVVG